jgi:protein-L-isoaspartate O-methyltransferase
MLDKEKIAAMRQQLKTGIKVMSAPQLFPTPPHLAERMAEAADIEPGMRILEPSTGTGRLLDAILPRAEGVGSGWFVGCRSTIQAVELNAELCAALRVKYPGIRVRQDDFLTMEPVTPFDRIVMNPPFKNGDDIKHIKRAWALLAPGGRLVALCAGGPRQRRIFGDFAISAQECPQLKRSEWEDLPPGTFSDEGTEVNCALVIMDKVADISCSRGDTGCGERPCVCGSTMEDD